MFAMLILIWKVDDVLFSVADVPMLGLPLGLQVHVRASWAPNTHVMEVLSMESLVASEAPSSYVNLAHKTIDQISP